MLFICSVVILILLLDLFGLAISSVPGANPRQTSHHRAQTLRLISNFNFLIYLDAFDPAGHRTCVLSADLSFKF
jgi:hypothetical protein